MVFAADVSRTGCPAPDGQREPPGPFRCGPVWLPWPGDRALFCAARCARAFRKRRVWSLSGPDQRPAFHSGSFSRRSASGRRAHRVLWSRSMACPRGKPQWGLCRRPDNATHGSPSPHRGAASLGCLCTSPSSSSSTRRRGGGLSSFRAGRHAGRAAQGASEHGGAAEPAQREAPAPG